MGRGRYGTGRSFHTDRPEVMSGSLTPGAPLSPERRRREKIRRWVEIAGTGESSPGRLRQVERGATPFEHSYSMRFDDVVTVEIIGMNGERIALPLSGFMPAGEHTVLRQIRDLPSGMYIVRVTTSGRAMTGRVVVRR